ncbi:MAG: phosphoribosylformylglycinamidine synthase [Synergistaceae bacterium]|nr:phosphoribosylformylglycinamidine synthase [Synergistaceae bacterium]MBQ3449883.1 phosphoribosylformylglycinamidine synthase [Synergistaceae bacterium]MBQ3693404.1 phosphoribosylformylglycinamidine synthase [Synergistaceae bacterium]
MVHRLYTTRKDTHNTETLSLTQEIQSIKGNENLREIKIFSRYDIQGLTDEMLNTCRNSIFAEPFTDTITESIPNDSDYVLAVEYLPGQYDQRADAAEQCAMLLLGFRPVIRTARVYLFYGEIHNHEAVKKFLINPVESREAQLNAYDSLEMNYAVPEDVKTIMNPESIHNLAMSREDLDCLMKYFESEGRYPTAAEIKVIDTYWSDHCRHTTFGTQIDHAEIHDMSVHKAFDSYMAIRKELGYPDDKPVTLMDIATIGAKYLRSKGKLNDLVLSEENNACTVRIDVEGEKWLLLFKNETHNHPTEIEPFGGAATCIGGAIRDPLSGRAYVYQAMRITGAADPFMPTMPGKLSQRSIITKAAQGYSSYGNQIGVPTGLVEEIYHEGYRAKRLEVGAVIAAVREDSVIRERPCAGDYVLLLGGRTGRDGIGGATGSSVSHNAVSLETCGAEVQKGNAPEERKLQRLFRNSEFTRLIKKCNDFGAGGVSVAVGELADGLDINLDAVPLKYAGLDGTEIAVSESQERMAVVVSEENVERVKSLALSEDVNAAVIARVNDSGRMRMSWRGKEIVNLSREFIDSNGADRHINIIVNEPAKENRKISHEDFRTRMLEVLADLNVCSKRGLAERFDSTVGAHTVLMPFGGKFQMTPSQVMAAKIPVGIHRETDTCSLMSWGFDSYISSHSCFDGAYLAVIDSLCRIIASGGDLSHCWLTFQEYFGKPEHDSHKWGLPFGALLGALKAQIDFGVAAIGGKDSMSGSFMSSEGINYDVPPTLISFAVSIADVHDVVSNEFKHAGSKVFMLQPSYDERGLPESESLTKIFAVIRDLNSQRKILSCHVPTNGGIIAAIFKMSLGNNFGFEFSRDDVDVFDERRGRFIVELPVDYAAESSHIDAELITHDMTCDAADYAVESDHDAEPSHDDVNIIELGHVINSPEIIFSGEHVSIHNAEKEYNSTLESIFPTEINESSMNIPSVEVKHDIPKVFYAHKSESSPRFLIPVFAGTNCEYETAKAVMRSGGKAEIFVVKTLTPELMKKSSEEFSRSLKNSQALILPGGFSNGDEPDGSGKFIAIFLRSVRESIDDLLNNRGGLICGICNGFQALVKTGLLPSGRICEPEELNTTLTFNRIGRHQSRIINAKIISNHSAWLRKYNIGDVYSMPISHGEGRFMCEESVYSDLMQNGQIAAQYVDLNGNPSMSTQYNPSGSCFAVECVTSPDGRVLGRMGHAERVSRGLYKNVCGNYDLKFFESACEYFMRE